MMSITPWNTAKYSPVIHGSTRRMCLTCTPLMVPTASSSSETLAPMSKYFTNSTVASKLASLTHVSLVTSRCEVAMCARRVSAGCEQSGSMHQDAQ